MIKSRTVRWEGHLTLEEKRNAYRVLVRKPEDKRPPGRLYLMAEYLNGS